MVNFCKGLCWEKNISYKPALKYASPSYKTRKYIPPEKYVPIFEVLNKTTETKTKENIIKERYWNTCSHWKSKILISLFYYNMETPINVLGK